MKKGKTSKLNVFETEYNKLQLKEMTIPWSILKICIIQLYFEI